MQRVTFRIEGADATVTIRAKVGSKRVWPGGIIQKLNAGSSVTPEMLRQVLPPYDAIQWRDQPACVADGVELIGFTADDLQVNVVAHIDAAKMHDDQHKTATFERLKTISEERLRPALAR